MAGVRAILLAALIPFCGQAAAECRLALALGMDVSGSVDDVEYRQQLDGLANALMSDAVRGALLAIPGRPVRITAYEWSGPGAMRILLPWTEIDGAVTLAQAAGQIRQIERREFPPETALGRALEIGGGFLAEQPCDRRTLDISGDGPSNAGPHPRSVTLRGVTVNGLVIGGGAGDLAGYYRAYVTQGPNSFVEIAENFADYEAAMRFKLLREIGGLAVAAVATTEDTPSRSQGDQ
ncbi:Protein of unknown function [Poseidonocella pacifica]|uniref:VWFA domain-containing protein n=1 Tax=Poseidonocella pacifica TaxID=871651 RepID=A0A1I0VVT1_9RHOB|nr:DUF1194 domain-containing protein [Poseidonocella pacifica]SFA80000.1 Protein of unknown function [Poseidonocella pacifica]